MRSLWRSRPEVVLLLVAALFPLLNIVLPFELVALDALRPILIFALMGLGLNIVTGSTGLLHLGVAAFMAIGAYSYAVLSCDIYPFQFGFWTALLLTTYVGMVAGLLLGVPTLRLRGDYLAIVTLGFGEIVQDLLRNLDVITKGTQGINPLPNPSVLGIEISSSNAVGWYYLLLAIVTLVAILNRNVLRSNVGRGWLAVREDALAAGCMGLRIIRIKLQAFALGAGVCALAGALWASQLGSTGEPGNYDFQLSTIVLCLVIVGGLGSIAGVLVGALVMIGFNSIVLTKISEALVQGGFASTGVVWTSPNNWKYLLFGLALIVMMRVRPEGLLPERHPGEELR
ncbi:MAG: branched-chain amino acid ABC transporter permease [Proteobacteria bacterium]|nr:branched-chain amino acid ABC transporter permease [Pseudomonadota bacterium]